MDESDLLPNFEPHRYLSAPWRMRYLRDGVSVSGCVFCSKLEADDDENNLVLWRGDSIFVMMNLYPYSTGHIMLAPYAHIATPEEIEPEIMVELGATIAPCMRALRSVLSCQGFNTGMNTGAVAGAGVADHMHLHIVPRWGGDANFMPIIGNTTVMPEALSVTYGRIRAALLEQLGAAL
ncbi:MAG: HIT domain-containing protein [Thermomicrobiales bacterium]